MKQKRLLFGLLISCSAAFGQQDPQFTQNNYNKLFPNPAAVGMNDAICVTGIMRNQWMGFEGSPKTGLISGNMPLEMLHGGIGATISYDQLGSERTSLLKLMYSFHLNMPTGKLNIGVSAGFLNKSIFDKWRAIDDPFIDNSIPNTRVNDGAVDFDLGVYYKANSLYVGLSSTHLSEAQLSNFSTVANTGYKVARHYYLMVGYNDQGNWLGADFEVMPSTLIKTDGSSIQYDVKLSLMYQNSFWGGVSYRYQDAIAPTVGFVKGSMKVGYSYDITTSKIGNYSNGSHEIMLQYCFKLPSKKQIYINDNVRHLGGYIQKREKAKQMGLDIKIMNPSKDEVKKDEEENEDDDKD